jgi:hypothetical protein
MMAMGRWGDRGLTHASILTCLALVALLLVPATSFGQGGPEVDGEVLEGEYPLSATMGDGHFELFWFIEGDTIQMAVRAQATGYVALGIDPESRMKGADMIIGWRTPSGDWEVHDTYALGETGPHPDDTDEGGTFDLNEYEVRESGGVTTMEFTRKLSTGDDLDKEIPTTGEVKFLWATSDDDEFSQYHGRRGTAIIDIGTGDLEAVEYPSLWPYHALFMTMAMIFFAATWFSVVHRKRLKSRYLNVHHTLGSLGVLFAIIGLVIGTIMVGRLESGHIRVAHSMLATADLVLGFLALAVGLVFLSRKELKRKTRKPHIYLGALAIVMMAATVLAGLAYVFP